MNQYDCIYIHMRWYKECLFIALKKKCFFVLVWIALIASAFKEVAFSLFSFFFFFFFFCFHAFLEECGYCSMNSAWTVAANVDFFSEQCIRALFMDPQISFFINFFIKNGSHGTIYTFKNYFATVISAISFQFQQNKSYPNRPLLVTLRLH